LISTAGHSTPGRPADASGVQSDFFVTTWLRPWPPIVANDPAPFLALLPTESDCRDYVVSEIEPLFAATPAVAGLLTDGERDTLLSRRLSGGSIKGRFGP
jgi:hypothetical protein